MTEGRRVTIVTPEEQAALKLEQQLISKIDDYEIKVSERDAAGNVQKKTITPAEVEQKVDRILGEEIRKEILHEGVNEQPVTTAREAFIKKVMTVLQDKSTDFQLPANGTDPRKQNPKNHTITLEQLLGKEGVALYKAAIEEERKSAAFRNAVFAKATNHYDGPSWKKRLIMWVGGPSASGKSFSSNLAIKKVGKEAMEHNDDNKGNDCISIDGGIERETSQMRKIALQIALNKGYPGIRDLHNNTKLGIKSIVQKAALKNEKLSLVIPATFTNPLTKLKIKKFNKINNVQQVFCETKALGEKSRFRNTISRMGNSRAWKQNFDKKDDIKANAEINSESKKYQSKYFDAGVNGSQAAREYYFQHVKNAIYVPIESDLIFVREDKKSPLGYRECEADYKGPVTMLSQRDYIEWSKENISHWRQNGAIKIPLTEFLDAKKQAGTLATPDITIQTTQPPSIILSATGTKQPETNAAPIAPTSATQEHNTQPDATHWATKQTVINYQVITQADNHQSTLQIQSAKKVDDFFHRSLTSKITDTQNAHKDRLELAMTLVEAVIDPLKKEGLTSFTVKAELTDTYAKLAPYIQAYCSYRQYNCELTGTLDNRADATINQRYVENILRENKDEPKYARFIMPISIQAQTQQAQTDDASQTRQRQSSTNIYQTLAAHRGQAAPDATASAIASHRETIDQQRQAEAVSQSLPASPAAPTQQPVSRMPDLPPTPTKPKLG